MIKLDNEFKYKGVNFKILKRGQKSIMLSAEAEFYDCPSVEVWQIRESKDTTIKGNFVPAREMKPSNEHYPYTAHQFMSKHYPSVDVMYEKANKRFDEYEKGIRPKKIENLKGELTE